MKWQKQYIKEMKKLAEKVESDFSCKIFDSDDANFHILQHKMLLEGLLKNFYFSIIVDKDLEKVELLDYWKGENDSTG